MEKNNIDLFFTTNGKNFPQDKIITIKESLEKLPNEKNYLAQSTDIKNPLGALVISFLVGYLGIDRFYIGDVSTGALKLLCGVACFIIGGSSGLEVLFAIPILWYLIDLFLIMKETKEKNYERLMNTIDSNYYYFGGHVESTEEQETQEDENEDKQERKQEDYQKQEERQQEQHPSMSLMHGQNE